MKYLLTCLIVALLAPFTIQAQQNIFVSGIIYDEYGMPLPGATVIEVGTVNGVSTDRLFCIKRLRCKVYVFTGSKKIKIH